MIQEKSATSCVYKKDKLSIVLGLLNPPSFGQSVYRQRMRLKLTQEEFAERADISKRHLQLIEADQVNPTLQIVRRIRMACVCQWEELLG